MSINLSALMKQRYDTAANWTAQNPTLLSGEIGIESDTKKWKVGTGSTAWTSLTYAIGGTYPIVNADIAAGAAIAYSKLATLTSGNIVLGSAANVATSTAVTGDVTISSTGVTAIASGVIVNADINASAAIVDTKLATIATAGKVSNSATTATNANTASAIVARDASGNFSAGTITAALTGNASTVTTNANLTGDVTSVGNATAIAAGVIVDADVNASAAIVDTKLATIATAGKVSNSATTAASANTASAIVARDASGNFTAGTITAALTGAASSNVLKAGDTMTGVLAVTAGTAALPGIAVSGDLNTGIYSPGADQLAISTGGTGRLFVNAAGLIDISNATSDKLTLSYPGFGIGTFGVDSTGSLLFKADEANTQANSIIQFKIDGGEKARIDSSGSVGIGTTSVISSCKLNVNTGINCNGLNASGAGGFFNAANKFGVDNNSGVTRFYSSGANSSTRGSYDFRITDSVGTLDTSAVVIDNTGRLLVGGSSDSGGALLQVFSDRIRIGTAKTPASATATGTAGEICWDANYIYVCTTTNTWKRTAISTW